MTKNKMEINGLKGLEKQYKNARGKSRSIAKKTGEDKIMIFSETSLKNHQNNWIQFSQWLDKNYKMRRLSQIKPEHVEKYINELNDKGMSKKTLQSRIGAINKVMIERWSNKEKPTLSKMKIDVKSTKNNSYKQLTAKEWKNKNEKRYNNYKDTFDTVSAFGLRKRELRELNEKSFLIDDNNKIFVQTIGKGGKYRIAECTNEKNDEMFKMYQKVATKINKIEDFKGNKELLNRAINDDTLKLNLRGASNERNSWHIFRSEYAQTLLKEKLEGFESILEGKYRKNQGYSTINVLKTKDEDLKDICTQIGIYKGSALAFVEVSRNLGHNRLDVMLKYV